MMPAPELSDSGALDYGLYKDGDEDIYTVRFDEFPQIAIPLPGGAEDRDDWHLPVLAAVEALVGRKLTVWPCPEFPDLAFPLFTIWALGEAEGSSVMLNNRPADAPPPPPARW